MSDLDIKTEVEEKFKESEVMLFDNNAIKVK
jgi:hypothetical protein